MYTLFFFIGVCTIIAIYKQYDSGWSDFVDYFFATLCGFIIGGALGLLVAFILPMDTYIKKYTLPIETLQDGSSIHGSFFLGSGHIDGKMKYVFYVEQNELYRMIQVDANLVRIKYTESKPKVNISEISYTDSFINYFAIDSDIGDKTYIIEVPKGTIQNNYKLDAQ